MVSFYHFNISLFTSPISVLTMPIIFMKGAAPNTGLPNGYVDRRLDI